VRYIIISKWRLTVVLLCFLLICSFSISLILYAKQVVSATGLPEESYIKWVDFNVSYPALKKAVDIDIVSHTNEDTVTVNFIDILSYLACKYGNNFSKYRSSDMDALVKKLKNGESIEALSENMKHFDYYKECYKTIFGEFLGDYTEEKNGQKVSKYGLTVFSPIAKGYYYSSYDDFGAGRSYGYKRKHLGHDIMASQGTPVIAVESGTVTELGWNQYGGWRIGIRSFDTKRYYYYAHLQKDKPYHSGIELGKSVTAGDVIGYVGRTGYSVKENVNNIEKSHLHFGLQLIFDPSQEKGSKEIWVDLYAITKLLKQNASQVKKNSQTKDFDRITHITKAT